MKKISVDKKTESSSLSRVLRHLDRPNLGVVSAFIFDETLSPEELRRSNLKRTEALKKDVRKLGLGFILLDSKWEEDGEISSEISLFIPDLTFKDAVKLGKKYEQHSVLAKTDDGKFAWVGSRSDSGVGKILEVFSRTEISESDFTGAFSQLLKGSHRDRRIKFAELHELTRVPLHCSHTLDYPYNSIYKFNQ